MASDPPAHTVSSSRIAFWLAGVAAAVIVGWVAAKCHSAGWAPVGILPLGIGALLGLAIRAIAGWTQTIGGRTLAAAFALTIVAILAEHTWLYADFRRQWHDARASSAEATLFRPEAPWSPEEYFGREVSLRRVAIWVFDAGLIVAGALGVVWLWPTVHDNSRVVADDAYDPLTPDH